MHLLAFKHAKIKLMEEKNVTNLVPLFHLYATNRCSCHMIIKENKFKVVKWGFNATTNDFPKSCIFEWKDKSGGHSHTHIHNQFNLQSLHESLGEYSTHIYYFFSGMG